MKREVGYARLNRMRCWEVTRNLPYVACAWIINSAILGERVGAFGEFFLYYYEGELIFTQILFQL